LVPRPALVPARDPVHRVVEPLLRRHAELVEVAVDLVPERLQLSLQLRIDLGEAGDHLRHRLLAEGDRIASSSIRKNTEVLRPRGPST
jgi:hypothetical protein